VAEPPNTIYDLARLISESSRKPTHVVVHPQWRQYAAELGMTLEEFFARYFPGVELVDLPDNAVVPWVGDLSAMRKETPK
jgi:hypothetical protein